jgi:hypothetical protein
MRRGVAWVAVMALSAGAALAGPVEVYRTGPEFCPQDRPPDAQRITPAEAIARAQQLLPRDFCGPSRFVSGCSFDVENEYDSWRVYAHQYKDVKGRRDQGGLEHTYLILDAVGNCLAHIPGTRFGAER